MKVSGWFRSLVVCTSLLPGSLAFPAAVPPAEHFARPPAVRSPSLSPEGNQLIYLRSDERGHFGLGGVDLRTMNPFAISLPDQDVYDLTWVTEEEVAFNVAQRRKYSRGLYRYKIGDPMAEGINEKDLTEIISVLEADRTRMYLWYRAGASHRRQGLALIDTDQRRAGGFGRQNDEYLVVRWVKAPPGEIHGWRADRAGQVRIGITFHQDKLRAWIHEEDDDPWRELAIDLEESGIAGFTGDGKGLYVVHDDGASATEALRIYDLDTQTLGPVLFQDPEFGLDGATVRYSRKEASAVGITYERDAVTSEWFSERFRDLQARVNAKLPGRVNLLTGWDREETRFIVASFSDRQPTHYYLYAEAKDAMTALPAAAPWIEPAAMQPMQAIRFKSRDGLRLQGYLTLPVPRADGVKPALVVQPHGGPWSRDSWGWNSEVQFLVSRGYAVFQPNYRGSTGFTRDVTERRSEFRAMLDDVLDGTTAVTRSGMVDPDRVAIYGGSFGGYLALAGVTFAPDRFKCAVSFAGVFDWEKLVEQDRFLRNRRALRDFRRRYVGDPKDEAARFEAMSPINHVANIRVPLLLVHGTDDRVVDEEQTRNLVRALKANGIVYETLFFRDEGHGLSKPANATKFLERLEQFLAAHL